MRKIPKYNYTRQSVLQARNDIKFIKKAYQYECKQCGNVIFYQFIQISSISLINSL